MLYRTDTGVLVNATTRDKVHEVEESQLPVMVYLLCCCRLIVWERMPTAVPLLQPVLDYQASVCHTRKFQVVLFFN